MLVCFLQKEKEKEKEKGKEREQGSCQKELLILSGN
jgi:hypothetical protein